MNVSFQCILKGYLLSILALSVFNILDVWIIKYSSEIHKNIDKPIQEHCKANITSLESVFV